MKKTILLILLIIIATATLTNTTAQDITNTYTITNTIESLYTTTHYIISLQPDTYVSSVTVTLTNTLYTTTLITKQVAVTEIPTGTIEYEYKGKVITVYISNYSESPTVINTTLTAHVYEIIDTTLTTYTTVITTVTPTNAITKSTSVTTITITQTATTITSKVYSTKYLQNQGNAVKTLTVISTSVSVIWVSEKYTTYKFVTDSDNIFTVTTTTTVTATFYMFHVDTRYEDEYGTSETVLYTTTRTSTYSVSTTTITSVITSYINPGTIIMLGTTITIDDYVALWGYRLAAATMYIGLAILAYTLLERTLLFAFGKISGRELFNTILFAIFVSVIAIILDWVLGVQ